MHSAQDTIVAMATPWGESGVGVVRLSGPEAIAVAQSIFRPAKLMDLASAPSHTCYFGSVVIPAKAGIQRLIENDTGSPLTTCGDDAKIDQAVVTIFRNPHSYTGEDVVEISAHGSPFILNQILQACVRQGARLAGPGEFTQRAFLAGKMDLTQAEAVADLIRAKTDQSHAAALSQLEGHLSHKVRGLREQLLPLLAHLEVGLDHSDEDHDFMSRERLSAQCRAVQQDIEKLLSGARVGKILREGLRVALIGRPNVGKSSLLNALLKEERAIVTPIPGTTRDTLDETVDWEGLPVVLTDTAGVREHSEDPVERLGMERTRKTLENADLIMCVFDASEPLSEEDHDLLEQVRSKPHLCVMNKIDLERLTPSPSPDRRGGNSTTLAHRERVAAGRVRLTSPTVYISAKTGEGLDELVKAVKEISGAGRDTAGSAHWMINVRHQAALQRAHEALNSACEAAHTEKYEECVALELQTTLQALGEIIGETTTEDLLDQIFSKFCIGK